MEEDTGRAPTWKSPASSLENGISEIVSRKIFIMDYLLYGRMPHKLLVDEIRKMYHSHLVWSSYEKKRKRWTHSKIKIQFQFPSKFGFKFSQIASPLVSQNRHSKIWNSPYLPVPLWRFVFRWGMCCCGKNLSRRAGRTPCLCSFPCIYIFVLQFRGNAAM